MRRFNRSFIGLMEECNTGDWIKKADVDVELNRIMDIQDNDLEEAICDFKRVVKSHVEEINDLRSKCKALGRMNANLIDEVGFFHIVNTILIIALAVESIFIFYK